MPILTPLLIFVIGTSVYMGSFGYMFTEGKYDQHDDNDSQLHIYYQLDLEIVDYKGHTEAVMKEQATYSGWNFNTVWQMPDDSTPTLMSMPSNIDIADGSTAEPTTVLSSLQLSSIAVPSVVLSAPVGEGGGDSTPPPIDPKPGDPPIFVEF